MVVVVGQGGGGLRYSIVNTSRSVCLFVHVITTTHPSINSIMTMSSWKKMPLQVGQHYISDGDDHGAGENGNDCNDH